MWERAQIGAHVSISLMVIARKLFQRESKRFSCGQNFSRRTRNEYVFYEKYGFAARKKCYAMIFIIKFAISAPRKRYQRLFLKQCVNKRRQGRALRQDDQQAQQQHDKENRAKPPFFAHAHKSPKFTEN
jgi:hypothetical protein